MAFPGMEFWQGAGAAGIPFAAWFMRMRMSRETRAQALYDKIMHDVRLENAALKAEIEECKKREARLMVIEICFRMMLAELIKLDHQNSVLVHVKVMLEAGPLPTSNTDLDELLNKIDRRMADGE